MEQKFDLLQCTDYQKPVFAAQQLRGAAGAWWANLVTAQPAGHRISWQEFHDAFRAHYIPDGVMTMKLDEFLTLKQGDQTVLHYVGKFNHLSQYAAEYVNTDAKKKSCFRGLNTKIRTMMTACYNATYHEIVNIAIALEETSRIHKESKKKKQVSSGFSGSNKKGELAVGHYQSRKLGATHLHSHYLPRDTAFSFTLASGHRRPVPPSTLERNFAK
jgi:hypothetical protein